MSVAELVVPGFADWGFVELLGPTASIVREGMAWPTRPSGRSRRSTTELYPLDPDSPVGSPQ